MNLYIWKYEGGRYHKTLVIDYSHSIIWISRFHDAGEFELRIPADAELLKLFSDNETLITRDVTDTSMIPEVIERDTDNAEGDYLIITGKSAEGLLGRRVAYGTLVTSDKAELIIRSIVTNNMISTNSRYKIRNFPLLKLGEQHNYTETIETQFKNKTLLEGISDACKLAGFGFRMPFDGEYFTFDLYKGIDRSLNQSENAYVLFSPEFENLGNTSYICDRSKLYNGFYAVNGSTLFATMNEAMIGDPLQLREKWLDVESSSDMTTTEFGQLLNAKANEELTKEIREYSGEILNTDMYKFGRDYELGDRVSIVNQYGIRGTAVVTEITEVEDAEGYRLIPTFSDWEVE